MKSEFKKNIELIEHWALLKIIHNYELENTMPLDNNSFRENVVRDLSATYPLCIFRILPNYARLLVIEMLERKEILSLDNIHYIENELRNDEEAYESYNGFIIDKAREIKRKKRMLYV